MMGFTEKGAFAADWCRDLLCLDGLLACFASTFDTLARDCVYASSCTGWLEEERGEHVRPLFRRTTLRVALFHFNLPWGGGWERPPRDTGRIHLLAPIDVSSSDLRKMEPGWFTGLVLALWLLDPGVVGGDGRLQEVARLGLAGISI